MRTWLGERGTRGSGNITYVEHDLNHLVAGLGFKSELVHPIDRCVDNGLVLELLHLIEIVLKTVSWF